VGKEQIEITLQARDIVSRGMLLELVIERSSIDDQTRVRLTLGRSFNFYLLGPAPDFHMGQKREPRSAAPHGGSTFR
jgi:hypothetical protein